MDPKLLSDIIASIRKALEEFVTPSLRDVRKEAHADNDQVRADIEVLRQSVAQLQVDAGQQRQETSGNFAQVREEARQFRAETAGNFAQVREDISGVRREAQQLRAETAANFAQVREEISGVRKEAQQFRAETTIQFVQVREEISDLRGEVNSLRSAMERGFSEIGAKLDMQADVQRLKEQVASLQAGQQIKALEAH